MSRAMLTVLAVLAVALTGGAALGHEVRPAYLEIKQADAERYDLLWKGPARGDRRLGVYVRLPERCKIVGQPSGSFAGDAFVERWTVVAPGGLTGAVVNIDGLVGTQTDVLARVERLDGTTQTARLSPAVPAFTIDAVQRRADVARTYTVLGIEHILGGVDHLLYITAMLFLVKGWRRVLLTMTAFTATHSLTLTAAALGFVRIPPPPVEASIALSIVFVAREIVYARRGQPGLAARRPWLVSFTFGLLHGLGFAGALSEIGLPQGAIPVALLFFNAGVEIGQIVFVAGVLGVYVGAARVARVAKRAAAHAGHRPIPWLTRPRLAVAGAYAIGTAAMFWVIERTAAFWS